MGPDLARLLLAKADEDEFAVRHLAATPESPDSVIGFHAPQAVEKILKAVLVTRRVEVPRTHNLYQLLAMLDNAGTPLPQALQDLRELQPYAVQFRYDIMPTSQSEPLDRRWLTERLDQLRQWCRTAMGDS